MVWIYSNILSAFPIHGGATHFGCFKWIAHASPSYWILPRMQLNLDRLTETLKRRPLRTENNRTPLQLWVSGKHLDPECDPQAEVHMWNQMINLVIDRPVCNFFFFLQLDLEVKIWLCDYYVNSQCKIFESLIK